MPDPAATLSRYFATLVYRAPLQTGEKVALIEDLTQAAISIGAEDKAGRAWSKANGYQGYTSYASLNDLPQRASAFADLKKHLDRHVGAFARDCGFDLGGRKLKLDSLWINILKPGGVHTGHIHPHSVISGTCYLVVPDGASALKLEDPRLPMMMAAPPRHPDAQADLQPFVYLAPKAGDVILWESWLRHEVTPNAARTDRLSLSFNYKWG